MTTTAITALASASLHGSLSRANVIGADKKGRTLVEMTGEASAAEVEWGTLCALLCLVRMVRRSFVTTL